jgi:hypothetical protein
MWGQRKYDDRGHGCEPQPGEKLPGECADAFLPRLRDFIYFSICLINSGAEIKGDAVALLRRAEAAGAVKQGGGE